MGGTVFVTVGTTLFDKLVAAVSSAEFIKWIADQGYSRLVLQYGKGAEPVMPQDSPIEAIECYRFRPTLDQDMKNADLIISHAGAGTVMEAMKLQKRLVVVINTLLMDNHQTELAHEMGSRGHLLVVEDPEEMNKVETWKKFEDFSPKPFEDGDDNDFPQIVDALMGFNKDR